MWEKFEAWYRQLPLAVPLGLTFVLLVGLVGIWLRPPAPASNWQVSELSALAPQSEEAISSGKKEHVGRETTEEAETTSAPAEIYCEIKGAVNQPGVYRLSPGSRLMDLIDQAQGLRADAYDRHLNQAQLLEDQASFYVYSLEELETATSDGQLGPAGAGRWEGAAPADPQMGLLAGDLPASTIEPDLVNINQAEATQLETLPGIGPKKAAAIINHRQEYGSFERKEDLMEVSGIGAKTYAQLESLITVGGSGR